MIASLAVLLLLAPPAPASEFLDDLHRADTRAADDPERIEYAARAIREWTPSQGNVLLADAYFRRGEGELEAYNDPAAEADLGKARELDPANDKALLLRGRARLRLGRAADAEKDFDEYTDRRGDDGEGWLGLAEARVARGLPRADRPALEAAARAARALDEDDPRVRIVEGRAHLAADRPLKAEDSFDVAVENAKDLLPDALAWRARAKADLGDPRGARADAGKAADGLERRLDERRRARAPSRAVAAARADLADVLFRRGRSDEKLSLSEDALADYGDACELGRADACARADALTPKNAPPEAKPPKRRHRGNPSDDPGTRIYAN